jgi:hypothetical protein
VKTRSTDEAINKKRADKGTLLASGLLAGGAIIGVISAILKYAGVEPTFMADYSGSPMYNILAIVMFVGLCCYLVIHATRTEEKLQ